MATKDELSEETKKNKEFEARSLELKNKILESKLNYLELLKEHYENYWLDIDLQCLDARIGHYVSKARSMVYETKAEFLANMLKKLNSEKESLDKEIVEAQLKLEQFKSLDPDLLAEYRSLKDDLECQDMLIKISENNFD